MIRFLPIVLLAFGLVLAFSSLASAQDPRAGEVVCLEEPVEALSVASAPPEKHVVRCWKKLKTGLIVTPCPPDPAVAAAQPDVPPPWETFAIIGPRAVCARDGVPRLHLPPPKA